VTHEILRKKKVRVPKI